jgi:hypothetical protein
MTGFASAGQLADRGIASARPKILAARNVWPIAMQLFRILLFLILCMDCARAQESAATKYGFSKFPNKTLLAPASYHLTFLRAEPEKDYGSMGIFEFRHSLDEPIRMWGFGFQKDGSLRVRFEQFSKLQEGRWKEVPIGYCGTGAQTYELAPNRDYLLRVSLRPFAKDGTRGVVLLTGETFGVISDEFSGDAVRQVVKKKTKENGR